jgi:phosphatidylglycerophosphate synthase
MLDGAVRRLIGPGLDRLGGGLAERGISADQVTVAGFALGLAAAAVIAMEFYIWAVLLILASRLCDGLDGAIARKTQKTDRGGFLDIVLDFAFYGLIPVAFAVARPEANALAAATLLFSFYLNGTTFLAYAVMAERRSLVTELRGEKSLYFTAGLAEATETILVLLLVCLFPAAFAPIAYLFAALTLLTAASRIALAVRTFGSPDGAKRNPGP